jgi:hypothetical protein
MTATGFGVQLTGADDPVEGVLDRPGERTRVLRRGDQDRFRSADALAPRGDHRTGVIEGSVEGRDRRQVGVVVELDVMPGAHVRMRHIDRRPVRRERLDASANGKYPDVHRPTTQSGGGQGLVCVGPIHRHVLEQRQATPARAITIEEVKQYDAVVGHEHRLGRSALATQRELEDIALLHGLIAVTHVPALRITFVTGFKAG